jgi:hypothetical protein
MSRAIAFGLMAGILAASCVSAPGFASSSDSYRNMRSRLIRDGWHPFSIPAASRTGVEELVGDTREMYNAGFHEVRSCSGTGLNYCLFVFKKGGLCNRVETQGELNPDRSSPVVVKVRTYRCSEASEQRR